MRKRPPLLSYFDGAPVEPGRSRTMSRIRGKNTRPELLLRSAVWRKGGRYRCHAKAIPGTPDIANASKHIAVFVDGCFWHGCPTHFRPPKTRERFWTEKIRRNRETRKRTMDRLGPSWRVIQFYECEILSDSQVCADLVVRALKSKSRRGGARSET